MANIKVKIDFDVVGRDSMAGLITDLYLLLDKIESGIVDPVSVRAECDQIRARHKASLKADSRKAILIGADPDDS